MDRIDELLADVFARPPAEWPTAVAGVCDAERAHADEIRRRFEVLRRAGLAASEPTGDDAPFPERFGPYRLLHRLGGGGMGVVYLARHEDLGRNVALKLMRPERLYFPEARERFKREVEAVARLEHPGCVQIHQVGETQGVPYFAMEHVAGVSFEGIVQALAGNAPAKLTGHDLAAVLRQASQRSVETGSSEVFSAPWVRVCLRLVLAGAEALAHAHARGVIHRDVKPSNLMLTPEGRVVVIDFGLAVAEGTSRMTRTGAFLGSLPYMAPEQIRGEQKAIDARTDVYALGVCLYELLTLVSPFESARAETTRDSILAGKATPLRVRNPAVSADVAVICATAIDLDPRRRYQTVADLAADLAAVLEHRAIAARPSGLARRAARWARRHPAAATATVLSALALLLGPMIVTVAIAGQRDRAREAETLARRHAYAANVVAANAALLAGRGNEARRRLDACPEDLRGFEWQHLDLALDGALLTLRAHAGPATAVSVSADARRLASGAENGEVAVFDATTGDKLHALAGGDKQVVQLEFDAGAAQLFSTDVEGHLRVFDVGTGKLLRERAPPTTFEALVIAPRATTLVCDRGGGRIARLDPTTLVERDEQLLTADGEWPRGFFLSDGVRLCAASSLGGFALWDLDRGTRVGRVALRFGASSMNVQAGLGRVAGADGWGNLAWWDVAAGVAHSLDAGGRPVHDIAITADGRFLVAGCTGGELLVYDLAESRLVRTLYGHRGAVRAVVAATGRGLVATAGADGSVRLWSVLLAPQVLDLRGAEQGNSVCVAGDGALFTGAESSIVQRWDVREGSTTWQASHGHWVNAMALARGDTVLVTSYHSLLQLSDPRSGEEVARLDFPAGTGRAYRMVVDASGERCAVATQSGHVVLCDLVTPAVVRCAHVHQEGWVWDIAFDPERNAILTAGGDGRIVELDAHTLAERRTLAATGAPVTAMLLEGDTLLSCERGALCRRDRRSGEIVGRHAMPGGVGFTVLRGLSPTRFVAGMSDGRVGFWDRQALEPILDLKQEVQEIWNLAVHPRGDWVAVQGHGGIARVLYAVRATGGDVRLAHRRALLAAARDVAAQHFAATQYSPTARQALVARADIDPELRDLAIAALPLSGLWWPAVFANSLAQSPDSAGTRRADLLCARAALDALLPPGTDHGQFLMARAGLGLVNLRLDDPAAALAAIAPVLAGPMTDVGRHAPALCLVRAWAHARLGRRGEAEAAYADLRALVHGDFARDPVALGYLREVEDFLER